MKGTDIVTEPRVWVCGACGKRARSRYGFDEGGKSTALDRGWDASCMSNAVLCEPTPVRDVLAGAPLWSAVDESAPEGAVRRGGAADPHAPGADNPSSEPA